jgi:hypothetical protein
VPFAFAGPISSPSRRDRRCPPRARPRVAAPSATGSDPREEAVVLAERRGGLEEVEGDLQALLRLALVTEERLAVRVGDLSAATAALLLRSCPLPRIELRGARGAGAARRMHRTCEKECPALPHPDVVAPRSGLAMSAGRPPGDAWARRLAGSALSAHAPTAVLNAGAARAGSMVVPSHALSPSSALLWPKAVRLASRPWTAAVVTG